MKFILSFLVVSSLLSAGTCYKTSLGHAAVTPTELCKPVDGLTPPAPVECQPPSMGIPTQLVAKCELPKPTTPPIECPKTPVPPGCNPPPPTSATPEPTSYALLGAGLMTAGIARKFRKKKTAE